jgi:capsular polysaccharide biosynthesis protein
MATGSQLGPEAIAEHERAARQYLKDGRIDEAAQAMRLLYASQLEQGLNIAVCRDAQLDPGRQPGDPYVALLTEVELDTAFWTVFDQQRAYPKESYGRAFANSPLVQRRVSRSGDRYLVAWYSPSLTIEEPCILVGSDTNYSHWLMRSLLKLWLVHRDPALRELRWVVASELTPFQDEFLRMLEIRESQLLRVPAGSVVHFRVLHVPTQMLGNRGFAEGTRWLQAMLRPWLARPEDAHDLIYVARTDTRKRRVVNEDEVFCALEPLGFRRLALSGMTVCDQVGAFSRARCIVGPHGAGLTNLIFSPPGTGIVEIASTNVIGMGEFRWSAPLLQQRIVTVVSDDYVIDEQHRREVSPMHWHYRAPVAKVRDAALGLLR